METLRRAASVLLCSALVWVSPGLEAYAAEGRIIPIAVNAPVNGGAGATVKPLQLPGALEQTKVGGGVDIPTLPVRTLEAGDSAAGLVPTQLSGPQAANPEAQASLSRPEASGLLANPAAPGVEAKAIAPESAAAVAPASTVDAAGEIKLSDGKKAERVANVGLIRGGLRAIKNAFSFKTKQTLTESSGPSVTATAGASVSQARLDAPAKGAKDDKVSQGGGDNAPPAPPAGPTGPKDDGKPSKGPWLGLGIAGLSLIGYQLAMQVGLEAQGVAMPQLTENAFKDFTLLPLVTIFASIGSMIGQPMSKFFTDHFGLAKTFYAAHALRAVSLGAMVLLFGTGFMSMPLMMAFYMVNGVVTGVATTAEGTLRKLILAEKGISQQRYRTWWQLLAETLAVPAPIFFGGLVLSLGALGAPLITAIYPVTIMLGLLLAYILKVYPLKDVKKASDAAAAASGQAAATDAAAPVEKASRWARFKARLAKIKAGGWAGIKVSLKKVWPGFKGAVGKIFRNMEEGKNYVLNIPYLKYALSAAVIFDLFNVVIYRLIAPGYGKMTGGAAGLSAVQGNIVGMFSLGGLLLSITFIALEWRSRNGGFFQAWRNLRGKPPVAKVPPSPEKAAAAERSSVLRWTLVGIPALALLGTMALNIALPLAPLIFMGTNWMPGSLLAAALIPFGFFQVAASIKLNSYYQESLPHDAAKVQKALAFSGSMMTALSIVTMLIMRPLFSAVTVFNPFPWLALGLLPAAGVGLFFLQRKLAAATTPEAIAAADKAQKEREEGKGEAPKNFGAYVGLILGIVSAAVVITALPMIPGVAGVMAGLGVIAKFAINLALTIAVPITGYFIGRKKGRAHAPKQP